LKKDITCNLGLAFAKLARRLVRPVSNGEVTKDPQLNLHYKPSEEATLWRGQCFQIMFEKEHKGELRKCAL
jgi:hypothetical protein